MVIKLIYSVKWYEILKLAMNTHELSAQAIAFVGDKLATFTPTMPYDAEILKLAMNTHELSAQATAFVGDKLATFTPTMPYDTEILRLAMGIAN